MKLRCGLVLPQIFYLIEIPRCARDRPVPVSAARIPSRALVNTKSPPCGGLFGKLALAYFPTPMRASIISTGELNGRVRPARRDCSGWATKKPLYQRFLFKYTVPGTGLLSHSHATKYHQRWLA